MSGGGSELGLIAATFLAGAAIKLLDAVVDAPDDGVRDLPAAAAYALAALALGALCDARLAATLFLAAYALGMAFEPARALPSGLCAWQESALALTAGAALAGPVQMGGALALMLAIQALDDLADEAEDRLRGRLSMVQRWGRGETRLVGLLALILAARWDAVVTAVALAAAGGLVVAWQALHRSNAPGDPEVVA